MTQSKETTLFDINHKLTIAITPDEVQELIRRELATQGIVLDQATVVIAISEDGSINIEGNSVGSIETPKTVKPVKVSRGTTKAKTKTKPPAKHTPQDPKPGAKDDMPWKDEPAKPATDGFRAVKSEPVAAPKKVAKPVKQHEVVDHDKPPVQADGFAPIKPVNNPFQDGQPKAAKRTAPTLSVEAKVEKAKAAQGLKPATKGFGAIGDPLAPSPAPSKRVSKPFVI